MKTELIEPLDEAKFLQGIELRQPELIAEINTQALVDYGVLSCAMRNGYLTGTSPSPTELLAQELAGEPTADPDGAATAISNAADTSFCESTLVEAP